jgi:D-sedoheptulose 7-phosphate isomerase
VANSEAWHRIVSEHQAAVEGLATLESAILQAAGLIAECLSKGKKVLFCGNGGSAADAQHLAAEFVGRFQKERAALPALALHTDTSALTSIANDYGFERVYARQVQAHGREGDVLVALSTSGNSVSVLNAALEASRSGMKVVGMTGINGGQLRSHCDVWIGVPSSSTARIQECHILIGHFLCEIGEASAQ